MAVSTTTASELTTEQVQRILVKPLEQKSVFLAAGPRIFDTNGSPVRIPKAPASVVDDVKWTAENEQITEADPDFDEVTLLGSGIRSLKVITRYSNELARQSVVALDAAIRDRLVADVALKLDAQFLGAAAPTEDTPGGIFGWTGTTALPAAGALTLDTIMDAYGLALAANVDVTKLRLFIRPEDYMTLRKLKDADGRFLLQPDASTGSIVVPTLGATVSVSSNVAAGNAALVDMSQIAVARDMAPSVKILTERYADFDQQAVRVVARYDAAPLNAEAVVKISGITA